MLGNSVLSIVLLSVVAPPAQPALSVLAEPQVGIGITRVLSMDRESSLHPEHNPNSPSYSGRSAPGPYHGSNPHGSDPHDENHDADLPANQESLPANEEQDKYYKGGLHAPDADSMMEKAPKNGDGKTDPQPGDGEPNDNDLKKQAPVSDKKRVSDLRPIESRPL